MGDKTYLLVIAMATRFPARPGENNAIHQLSKL
ncbi:TMEM165/GDT1 family protein [Sporotomaculum syntrophicum]|nr:TMEM165/GDT1 family protein [Sporotomaculum syntrophicum]